MQKIEIIAPTMDSVDAQSLIAEMSQAGYDVEAHGPSYGDGEHAVATYLFEPDEMDPASRKAFYESELARQQVEAQAPRPGRIIPLPYEHPAPTGWHIVATRADTK